MLILVDGLDGNEEKNFLQMTDSFDNIVRHRYVDKAFQFFFIHDFPENLSSRQCFAGISRVFTLNDASTNAKSFP